MINSTQLPSIFLTEEIQKELVITANSLATPGKGILAADETKADDSIGQRFSLIGLENTNETRRAYRELIFGTEGLNQYISGVILFDETLMEHKTKDGSKPLSSLLTDQGIIVGACVDHAILPLVGSNGESVQTGLDLLDEKCKKYYAAGARFAKWRAPYEIDIVNGKPSELVIREQAWSLARYAAIAQSNKLVPIVEPDIFMDGTHDIQTCARVSERVWSAIISELHKHGVLLEGSLLKPNMVTAGTKSTAKSTPADVAFYTLRTLQRTIPSAIPGVMFLSGGQTDEEATLNLDEINKLAKIKGNVPWKLSFSFGRSLQSSCRKAWLGKEENTSEARKVFFSRCKANSEAATGTYSGCGIQL